MQQSHEFPRSQVAVGEGCRNEGDAYSRDGSGDDCSPALLDAGFVKSKKVKQYTFYKGDEERIAATLEAITRQI